jgi:hypothetical protein
MTLSPSHRSQENDWLYLQEQREALEDLALNELTLLIEDNPVLLDHNFHAGEFPSRGALVSLEEAAEDSESLSNLLHEVERILNHS